MSAPVSNHEGFFSSFDQTQLYYRLALHEEARDLLIYIHGHGEHLGRYSELSKELQTLPLSLAGFDLRGCGKSGGTEVSVHSFQDYLTDISSFVEFLIKEKYATESQRFIFLGHSLGGLIALSWLLDYPRSAKGLIVSAPLWGLHAERTLNCINSIIFKMNPDFVYKNPVVPKHLSHDLSETMKYRSDPLIRRKMSARLLREIFRQLKAVRSRSPYSFTFPVLGLFAGDERIVHLSHGLKIFEAIQSPQKSKIIYTDYYHELFHETNRAQIFSDLKKMLQPLLG